MTTEIGPIVDPFASWGRGKVKCDQIVIHESVTRTRAKTIAVLRRRKPVGQLGVHVIVDRDGSVTQHAPLAQYTAHGGAVHNRRSVGVEVVNPYYGSAGDDGDADIEAVWAHKGWYILPTLAQLESVWVVVMKIIHLVPTIPLAFPGVDGRRFRWGPLADPKRPGPGVMAHHRTAHADGLFLEHYCLLRAYGWPVEDAYYRTLEAARSGKRLTTLHRPTLELPP